LRKSFAVKISASIIVYNEEDNIAELCETVSWADEIVIVDSSSTDRTIEIAKQFTDKIFQREFLGYKDKHEYADSMTTGDWIFWIDADERVTPELLSSIEKLRSRNDSELPSGFRIARKTWYEGRWIMHGGWYPDHQMRLYRKADSFWDGVAPHQTARVAGKVETLDGELLHYTKRDLSDHHRVTDRYATLAAEHLAKSGVTSGASKMFFSSIAAFVRTYILKQGFRDGVPGLMIAMFTAYGVFLKYAKVWERVNLKK
jgi:glycosyltransferase involved in cell wall biosynthesis